MGQFLFRNKTVRNGNMEVSARTAWGLVAAVGDDRGGGWGGAAVARARGGLSRVGRQAGIRPAACPERQRSDWFWGRRESGSFGKDLIFEF